MRYLAMLLSGILVSACVGNVRTSEPVHYDFGDIGGDGPAWRIPVVVDVQAAPWLSGPGMHFRLAYAEPLRRQSYVESRWAAAPAELLETHLRRRSTVGQPDAGGVGCRLHLTIDEFEQRFEDARKSQAVLEARASLISARGADTLSRHAVRILRPAATPDARGGVQAARDAARALGDDLGGWLAELARSKPAIVERCRS